MNRPIHFLRHFPRPFLRTCAPAFALSLLAGCATVGLSPRETVGRDYSSYVYALYDDAPGAAGLPAGSPIYATQPGTPNEPAGGTADAGLGAGAPAPRPPARLVLPAKLGVAQVGEVAPPQGFLKKLRDQAGLFTRVEAVSGIAGVQGLPNPGRRHASYVYGPPAPGYSGFTAQDQARQEVGRMQQLARDMGLDHLLVVGGTIDHTVQDNGLGVMDLTIVGAFIVPSKEIKADARAAGALIDLKSGRVVMTASADASRGGWRRPPRARADSLTSCARPATKWSINSPIPWLPSAAAVRRTGRETINGMGSLVTCHGSLAAGFRTERPCE